MAQKPSISTPALNRLILALAIPNIISNLSTPLLSMADTALMGHLELEIYLSAIAMGGAIFNMIYWAFGFLRMGTTGMTAQAYGAKQRPEQILLLARGVMVALIVSLPLLLFQVPIEKLTFILVEGSAEVKVLASEYFRIRIWAAPATILLYAFHGWFLGMQNARYPMILAILVNVLNIGFNLIALFVFDMKHDGVALGTVLAQYAGLLIAVGMFFYKYRDLLKQLKRNEIAGEGRLKKFFSLNLDIFIRTLCLILAFNFVVLAAGSYGDRAIAVNSLILLLVNVMAQGVDGFAYAGESLVGRFLGEGQRKLLKKVIAWLFLWGMSISVLFSTAYVLFGEEIFSLFTEHKSVVDEAMDYLIWIAVIPVASAAAFLWDGIFLGATASRPMRNTLLMTTFLIFFPVWYFTRESLGNHSFWLALTLFMAGRSILLGLYSPRFIFNPK